MHWNWLNCWRHWFLMMNQWRVSDVIESLLMVKCWRLCNPFESVSVIITNRIDCYCNCHDWLWVRATAKSGFNSWLVGAGQKMATVDDQRCRCPHGRFKSVKVWRLSRKRQALTALRFVRPTGHCRLAIADWPLATVDWSLSEKAAPTCAERPGEDNGRMATWDHWNGTEKTSSRTRCALNLPPFHSFSTRS